MRSDFLGSLQQHSALTNLDFTSLGLGPMAFGDLVQVIARPAEVAGIDLEDGLAEEIAADADSNDALPLLAFALRELADRYADDRRIDLAEYRDGLGGLHGSIAGVADELLRSHRPSPTELDDLRRAFLAMVRIGDDGGFARTPVKWIDLPEASHPLLTRFVDARLLVVTASADESSRIVEVAHEALFRSWDQLSRWLDQGAATLGLRRDLSRSATHWDDDDRSPDHLWRGGRLTLASELVDSPDSPIDPLIGQFVNAGLEKAAAEATATARRRRRQVAAGIVAAVVLGVGGAAFGWLQLQNKQQRDDDLRALEAASVISLASVARANAALGGELELDAVVQAVGSVVAANGLASPSPDLLDQVTVAINSAQSVHLQNRLDGLSGIVTSVRSNRSTGEFGAVDDLGNARIWDRAGNILQTFETTGGTVWSAAISPDLTMVAVLQSPEGEPGAGPDTPITLSILRIDGSQSTEVRTELGIWADVLAFSGPNLIASQSGGLLRFWNLQGDEVAVPDGDPLYLDTQLPLPGPTGSVASLDADDDSVVNLITSDNVAISFNTGGAFVSAWDFDIDGRLAVGLRNGSIQIWNSDGVRPGPTNLNIPFSFDIAVGVAAVYAVEESGVVSSWGIDGEMLNRWDGPNGNAVPAIALSTSGNLLLSGVDGTVRYWKDADLSTVPDLIKLPTGRVLDIGFGTDGRPMVTLADGDVVTIIDEAGRPIWSSKPTEDVILDASGSPTGSGMVMVNSSGNFIMATSTGALIDLEGHTQFGTAIVWSSDGERVATLSADGALQAWNSAGELLARFQLPPNGGAAIAWVPDGSAVAATDDEGVTRIWDISTKAQLGGYETDNVADSPWSLQISPDGSTAVLSATSGVYRWDLDDLNSLTDNACKWIRDYLESNPSVEDNRRSLCDR